MRQTDTKNSVIYPQVEADEVAPPKDGETAVFIDETATMQTKDKDGVVSSASPSEISVIEWPVLVGTNSWYNGSKYEYTGATPTTYVAATLSNAPTGSYLALISLYAYDDDTGSGQLPDLWVQEINNGASGGLRVIRSAEAVSATVKTFLVPVVDGQFLFRYTNDTVGFIVTEFSAIAYLSPTQY